MKNTLAIIFGGCSSEYEVSLVSAAAVIDAVNREHYEVLTIGITRKGQWLLYDGGTENIRWDTWYTHPSCLPAVLSPSREDHGFWLISPSEVRLKRVDLVFPVLHGCNGEDGTVQGLLELSGIPFVGCGCQASAVCMDKATAHHLARSAGFACPAFVTVQPDENLERAALAVITGMKHVPLPWFVKPAREGSSFGVSRIDNLDDLPLALDTAFRYGGKVVAEQGIGGFEVGCAVMGREKLQTGAVDAISLEGGFFDFHEKYHLETASILLPAPLEPSVAERIKNTAIALYRLLGCRDFARVDLFLTGDGELFFNEINTIPGLTAHSRFPGMMRAAGLDFDAMVARLLEGAMPA